MPVPRFEEQFAGYTDTGYAITNEEPQLLQELLRGQRFNKGGGIASSGEVPLFVLLQHCREVICVDHSYRSLAASYLKIALLEALGPKELKKLLLENDWNKFVLKLQAISHQVPAELQLHVNWAPQGYTGATISSGDFTGIRREWSLMPEGILARAAKRLDRLTFVHGDLADLKVKGPFDLLYLSNCLEHFNRDKSYPSVFSAVLPLLAENGLVLSTYSTVSPGDKLRGTLTPVRTLSGTRTQWQHACHVRRAS